LPVAGEERIGTRRAAGRSGAAEDGRSQASEPITAKKARGAVPARGKPTPERHVPGEGRRAGRGPTSTRCRRAKADDREDWADGWRPGRGHGRGGGGRAGVGGGVIERGGAVGAVHSADCCRTGGGSPARRGKTRRLREFGGPAARAWLPESAELRRGRRRDVRWVAGRCGPGEMTFREGGVRSDWRGPTRYGISTVLKLTAAAQAQARKWQGALGPMCCGVAQDRGHGLPGAAARVRARDGRRARRTERHLGYSPTGYDGFWPRRSPRPFAGRMARSGTAGCPDPGPGFRPFRRLIPDCCRCACT